ncbi:adenine deaminase, partial [Phenoliferia sp. Uapishka_3]
MSNTTAFLKALPKCEHHLHIEGTFEPDLLFALAKENNIHLDPAHYTTIAALEERYKHFAGLDDFLQYYNWAMAALVKQSDYEKLAYAYMKKAHADGVKQAEVFFDPQAHVDRDIELSAVVSGLNQGLVRGEKEFGMTTKLIMCFVKHLPVESALASVESIIPFVKSGEVIGLGMDSSEIGNPPEKFAGVYERAVELGITHLTGHVGEEGPAASVRTAVADMGLRRIDHGIHAADDPEVLKLLKEKNVFLTVCPLSNVRLRCIEKVADHPIPKFMEAGVKFSINSDDPAYFGGEFARTSLSQGCADYSFAGYVLANYLAVQEAFNFSKSIWKGLMVDSIEGSWCDDARKSELLSLLDGVMAEFEGKEI